MAVLTRDEYMARLNALVGERTDDEALSILEDFTDTYTEAYRESEWEEERTILEQRITDAESRVEDITRRYRERFSSGEDPGKETTREKVIKSQEEDVRDDGEEKTFDSLFEERREKEGI